MGQKQGDTRGRAWMHSVLNGGGGSRGSVCRNAHHKWIFSFNIYVAKDHNEKDQELVVEDKVDGQEDVGGEIINNENS
jgi:hypothetical protein